MYYGGTTKNADGAQAPSGLGGFFDDLGKALGKVVGPVATLAPGAEIAKGYQEATGSTLPKITMPAWLSGLINPKPAPAPVIANNNGTHVLSAPASGTSWGTWALAAGGVGAAYWLLKGRKRRR